LNVLFQTAIDPGDEVILFDPSYESYEGCVTLAGGVPVSLLSSTLFMFVSYIVTHDLWTMISSVAFFLWVLCPFFCVQCMFTWFNDPVEIYTRKEKEHRLWSVKLGNSLFFNDEECNVLYRVSASK